MTSTLRAPPSRRLAGNSGRVWTETTAPHMVVGSIRFITPEVLADASNIRYGSIILVQRIPVLFVMKKEGADWRIASLRVLIQLSPILDGLQLRQSNRYAATRLYLACRPDCRDCRG
jgi:hypothetical protein